MSCAPENRDGTGPVRNISQAKFKLKAIIKNLQQLEAVCKAGRDVEFGPCCDIKRLVELHLSQLEAAPLGKLSKICAKRRKQRHKERTKPKAGALTPLTLPPRESSINIRQSSVAQAPTSGVPEPTDSHAANAVVRQKQKPHVQLRKSHDAQRFLRTFELLQILHLARGRDAAATRAFTAKFDHLRSVWNKVAEESTPERTQEAKIEDQWNEVLFGGSEKTYYTSGDQKLSDFLRIRRTWDSYLTHSRGHGTSIPVGWILPREHAEERWQQYKCQ